MTDPQASPTEPDGELLAILSGRRDRHSEPSQGLKPVLGRPCLSYVLSAIQEYLRNSDPGSHPRPTALLLNPVEPEYTQYQELLTQAGLAAISNLIISQTGPLTHSLTQLVDEIPSGQSLLITTADHPLLQASDLQAFRLAIKPNSQLAIGVVNIKQHQQSAKSLLSSRTWYRLNSDCWLSGANLYWLSAALLNRLRQADPPLQRALRLLEDHRKHPWQISCSLGVRRALEYALGQLSLSDAEQALSNWLQAAVQLVPLSEPLTCCDYDKDLDLLTIESTLAQRLS